jgi:predicted peroxiredoxin
MSYLINSSFGPGDLERATVPFVLACSAANNGTARVFLTGDALNLVVKGKADGLAAEGYTPVKSYIDEFVEKEGRIWVCRVCANVMGITQDDLIDGAEIGGAPDTIAFLEAGGKALY